MAAQGVSKFFAAIVSALSQLLPPSISRHLPPPQSQPAADIESVAEANADIENVAEADADIDQYPSPSPPAPPNLN